MAGDKPKRAAPAFFNPKKHIIVEVIGGDADGLYLDTHDRDPALAEAALTVWRLTAGGQIGQGMAGMSIANLIRTQKGRKMADEQYGQAHYYHVINRVEDDNQVLIQVKHKAGELAPWATKGTAPNQEE